MRVICTCPSDNDDEGYPPAAYLRFASFPSILCCARCQGWVLHAAANDNVRPEVIEVKPKKRGVR